MSQEKRITVTLLNGLIGVNRTHRATVRGLGLKRRHQTVSLIDTPAIRGMIKQVRYLLKTEV